jgi:predicted transcriptional regulator
MENLSALLFELANVDRLEILHELEEASMKLTNISKKLDLTMQETSRHLQRLCDAYLTEKKSDGAYHITEHGKNVLSLLPGLEFLVEYREYFISHRIDHLPREFIVRIGVLQGSKLLDNPVLAFQKVNTIIEEAKEEVSFVSDQVPTGSIPLFESAVKRGLKMRTLMPEKMARPDLPDSYLPHYDENDMERMYLGWSKSISFVGVISEKAAVVGFPTLEGKMDYMAFYTTEVPAIRWCNDLFMYYWNQVEPVHPTIE